MNRIVVAVMCILFFVFIACTSCTVNYGVEQGLYSDKAELIVIKKCYGGMKFFRGNKKNEQWEEKNDGR
ncbi:hypothetical protein II906_01790 [bacterium]|nr:hypothetical protein [bacterium]